jgi:hypothetical protein
MASDRQCANATVISAAKAPVSAIVSMVPRGWARSILIVDLHDLCRVLAREHSIPLYNHERSDWTALA